MAPLNSGDKSLEIWMSSEGWISFEEAYLTEATEYKLRYEGTEIELRIQGIPILFHKEGGRFFTTLVTPFQSGSVKVFLNGKEYETFIYPDSRKLSEQQFDVMIEEILEESNSCFQLSGLEREVSVSGKSRGASWTQWIYIERSMQPLRQIFDRIEKQPFSRLVKLPNVQKRERVQRVAHTTLNWLDKRGYGETIPLNVETTKTFETVDVYENQVLKKQLFDLTTLLRTYMKVERADISKKAETFHSLIRRWINSPFLQEVSMHQGTYSITQKFRKHPIYRQWYKWFEQLYKHDREGIGFDYPVAMKDTFQLYEMWCFMKIVGILRELNLVEETKGLYKTTESGIFIDLAQNKESRIRLRDGKSLYFQRNYRYNSKEFYTYTQRMIPDIVLECEKEIIVFDPKYRVPGNLGTALGEMHKYRDGIVHRETGGRAVREVYILTPTSDDSVEAMRYFQEGYHDRYRMGALQMVPGAGNKEMHQKILSMVNNLKEDTE
ncbi:DUF2357 domain-containing protein [Rossellomorea sp. KS-H15a]|uniref:DUF2357 domain-containing protein n=1 Tax=Rossellomorea sp. KS-H15a TaxID=2963940 RepID=UPI0020C69E39|nr:DUF2357 domain-containing protein [Rossellomorea sp. KS-H15a]UTE78494.1 restriction endonuclease-like protein [Rossellomorea sp. KS-H15a]